NLQIRAQSLQDEVRTARQLLAQREATAAGGTADSGTAQARDPNQPNPPAKMVRGKITKIDTQNGTLVQVDVRLDEGVKDNNTLEGLRTSPTPECLGMIRIVNADYHHATGRLIRTQFAPAKVLREGDQVASSLK